MTTTLRTMYRGQPDEWSPELTQGLSWWAMAPGDDEELEIQALERADLYSADGHIYRATLSADAVEGRADFDPSDGDEDEAPLVEMLQAQRADYLACCEGALLTVAVNPLSLRKLVIEELVDRDDPWDGWRPVA